jgi:hypothetical protein
MTIKIRGYGRIRSMFDRVKTAESRLRRQIWQRMNNPNQQTTPVFLVGCGRSGTSMMVFHLDKSWRVELYNEDNPQAFQNYRFRDFRVIDGLIRQSPAHFVIFKPILNTHQTIQMLEHFPTVRIIFALRHYTDVINSSLKRFGVMNRIGHVRAWMEDDFSEFRSAPPPAETKAEIRRLWKPGLNPESGAALYWFFYNRLYYDLKLNQHPRVRLVRYESLVAEPEKGFREICEFLGLPFEEKMIEGVFATSIRRDATPALDAEIQAACDALWEQMSREVGALPEPVA